MKAHGEENMVESLNGWTRVPRGPIMELPRNTEPTLEGGLRRQWAVKPDGSAGWREGLVAGNGSQGLVLAGEPGDEVLIFQNVDFVIPSPHPRQTPPEVGGQLEAARAHVLAGDDDWTPSPRRKTTVYSFHPGEQLRVRRKCGPISRYERATHMDRGELRALAEDAEARCRQRHFVSATDDIVVSEYAAVGEMSLALSISPDLPEEMEGYGWWMHGVAPETRMRYWLFASEDGGTLGLLAHYPDYEGSELSGCGWLTVSRVLCDGGTTLGWDPVRTRHLATQEGRPEVAARGRRVQIITRSALVSGMGAVRDFAPGPVSGRLESNGKLAAFVEAEAKKLDAFIVAHGGGTGRPLDYDRAILRHADIWKERMGRQALALEERPGEEALPLGELLARQKVSPDLSAALINRVYRLGRYVMFCCAGHTAPRLYGMWTGEWNPAWSAAYTMDANVNLQVSGMNTGNAPEAAAGYCAFVRRQMADWEENARQVYGMTDALLVPVNTDGRRAMMVEYDGEYPFEYWNAGASWMALPAFEAWQCFGDLRLADGEGIVDGLLRPLLRKTLNFWKQLCTPEYFTDAEGNPRHQSGKQALEAGERYLLIPGYSPENHPGGRKCALAMNTSMDIAAARDCLRMVRALERACPLPDSASVLAACDDLEKGLPDYRLDGTGALKEWACDFYSENNAHRHLSHLYGAWPAFEARGNGALAEAFVRAVENRERENRGKDDTPSHGWIHKLLILIRLKLGGRSADVLNRLLSTDVFYATGMTDHNTDRSRAVFCTDTLLGLQGVVQEMLLYSDGQRIELLPALPEEWRRGEARGFRLRSGGLVEYLRWNMDEGIVQMRMVPGRAAVLEIRFREDWEGSLAIDNMGEKPLRAVEMIAFSENAEYDFVWKAGSGIKN